MSNRRWEQKRNGDMVSVASPAYSYEDGVHTRDGFLRLLYLRARSSPHDDHTFPTPYAASLCFSTLHTISFVSHHLADPATKSRGLAVLRCRCSMTLRSETGTSSAETPGLCKNRHSPPLHLVGNCTSLYQRHPFQRGPQLTSCKASTPYHETATAH